MSRNRRIGSKLVNCHGSRMNWDHKFKGWIWSVIVRYVTGNFGLIGYALLALPLQLGISYTESF